jgi:hypothetical protein
MLDFFIHLILRDICDDALGVSKSFLEFARNVVGVTSE